MCNADNANNPQNKLIKVKRVCNLSYFFHIAQLLKKNNKMIEFIANKYTFLIIVFFEKYIFLRYEKKILLLRTRNIASA